MTVFIFDALWIMSTLEARARKVCLDASRNLITGRNGAGKSCITKGLWRALGAKSAKVDPRWEAAEAIYVLDARVDGAPYRFINHKDSAFGIAAGGVVSQHEDVASYGRAMAQLTGFRVRLPNRDTSKPTVPGPNFQFCPFYVDQEIAWTRPWSSFASLGQFDNWRPTLADYFSGIRPGAYYDLLEKKWELDARLADKAAELRALGRVIERLAQSVPALVLAFSEEDWKDRVNELLEEIGIIHVAQVAKASELGDILKEKRELQRQVAIARNAYVELRGDSEFATRVGHLVTCPTCAAEYDNGFGARFEINASAERCLDIASQLEARILELGRAADRASSKSAELAGHYSRLSSVLQTVRGDLKLQDVIDAEGSAKVKQSLNRASKDLGIEVASLESELSDLAKRLRATTNKGHAAAVRERFKRLFRSACATLNVGKASNSWFDRLDGSRVSATGSDGPRGLLAYYWSFLMVAGASDDALRAPFVIDSPNQNAQDPSNLRVLYEFLDSKWPRDWQMILATESLHGADLAEQVNVIEVGEAVLRKEEYEEVRASVWHDVERTLGVR